MAYSSQTPRGRSRDRLRWLAATVAVAGALTACDGATIDGSIAAVDRWHTAHHVPTADVTATPDASAPPASAPPASRPDAVVTRIVVTAAGIDLPVISGDRRVRGQGPHMYPPCDVALYHTSFGQPGQGRTTYLYAHAREGMFLPLLTAAERRDGASLIGVRVDVYTSDDLLHVYTITRVNRHATGFALVDDAPKGAEQLILQTSEGPPGTVPKLQVLALPDRVEGADEAIAQPRAHPRPCFGE